MCECACTPGRNLIFIIDDDEMILDIVEASLSPLKDELLVSDLEIKKFKDDSFITDPDLPDCSLLIVDIKLDDKDGIDLIRKNIVHQYPWIPTLFISGYPYNGSNNILPHSYIYDFIPKPLDIHVVSNRVSIFLKCSISQRSIYRKELGLENDLWDMINNTLRFYVIISKIEDSELLLCNNVFATELGYKVEEMKGLFGKDIVFDDEHNNYFRHREALLKYGYSEVTGYMKAKDGSRGPLVHWFASIINSKYNMVLHFGYPIISKKELEDGISFDFIRDYYQKMVSSDKTIISVLKRMASQ